MMLGFNSLGIGGVRGFASVYRPLINYTWSTVYGDTRKLRDSGTVPKYDANLYFGRGAKLNAVDQEIPVNTTNANVLYSFQNGILVPEDVSGVDTYTIISDDIHQNYISTSVAFTDSQVEFLTNNPERFLYREDDILKSQILTQSEIDNVVAYLPMCEVDGYVRELVGYSEGDEIVINGNFSDGTNGYAMDDAGTIEIVDFQGETNVLKCYYPADNDRLRFNITLPEVGLYLLEVKYYVEAGSFRFDASDTKLVGNAGATDFVNNEDYDIDKWTTTTTIIDALDVSSEIELWFRTTDADTTYYIQYSSIKKLTGTYPITNFTDAVRDDAQNLNTGLQTCFWKRDKLGVPTGGSFDRLECDGVGYADTGWIPDSSNSYHIEFVLNRDSKYVYSSMGSNRDLIRFYKTIITQKINDETSSSIAIPEQGVFHFFSYFDRTTDTHIVYINGEEKLNRTIGTDSLSSVNWLFNSVLKDAFRLFKIHDTPQDPLKLYNNAVKKGLLL